MKIRKQRIQQLFASPPSRAVDIIFSQYKPQQLHDFYSSLQQHKKNNTMSLKKTLENNYQKMLYCADLLDKVRKYADAVRGVAQQIQGCVELSDGREARSGKQGGNGLREEESVVDYIERMVRKGQFGQAMSASFNYPANMAERQRYYLFYLRIEIIQKLQRQICLFKQDESKLQQQTKCLQQFIYENKKGNIQIRQQLRAQTSSFAGRSLLGLIHKHMDQLSQSQSIQQSKCTILQLLLQYKLSTLKNKYKTEHTVSYFKQYFEQVAVIINLYKNLRIPHKGQQLSANKLKNIYKQCITHIKQQLSSIFIYRADNGQIVFRSQLYQQLIGNAKFQEQMTEFYFKIADGEGDVENPILFVKQLWHDYFVNLIDMLLDQTNPLARLETLKQHLHPHAYIPPQLLPYLHDHSLQQSLHIITQYSNKLQLLQRNLWPIIKKCNKQQLSTLQQKFNMKIHEITNKCLEYIQIVMSYEKKNGQVIKMKNEEDKENERERERDDQNVNAHGLVLRKYLVLRILVGMIGELMLKINCQFGLELENQYMTNQLKFVYAERVWAIFSSKYGQNDYIAQQLIDFDCFFIGYLQGTPTPIHPILIQSITEITLAYLTYLSDSPPTQLTHKQKDSITHTLQSLKQKKQKITILDTIALPYIAKNIFKCVMKPIKLDKQFYEKNFVCKPVVAVGAVGVSGVVGGDEFQIGEKEEKEELVRVNIGKSLMSLGNNIITGFMKKK